MAQEETVRIETAVRAAYDDYCLEQQLKDWNPKPSPDRLVELFRERFSGEEVNKLQG
jgi:hypothetical protein